ESQILRFEQLNNIISISNGFSLNDLGCGYGAFYDFLRQKYDSFHYFGLDVSQDMIHAAQECYRDRNNVQFIVSNIPAQPADFSVASGIFNVRLGYSDNEWKDYIKANLDILNRSSYVGFAFNCLTSFSDKNKMRDDLYYAEPCALFKLCKRHYSHNVAMLHDYGLYEFTILVRKKL
ncbi:MAG TPA: class I SAM-dependent methyltransferase, partial [Flavobacteriales bacterium]|nr:class I SAM-dependent methyltransferase [Flavobacteriales bacterium]